MLVREHLHKAETIEVVLNDTPQRFKRIEFSEGVTIDDQDPEKVNVAAGGGMSGGVITPTNQVPTNGTINVSLTPTLTGSSYLSVMGLSQHSMEVEIYVSTNLITPIYTGTSLGSTISHTVNTPLENAKEYHWRIRYKENNGAYSAWSNMTTFNTVVGISVTTPVVISPNLVSNIPENPMLVASAFSTSSGSDIHQNTQWQITNIQGNYNAPVWDSGWLFTDLTSKTVDLGYLLPNTTYYWRVRYKGQSYGWSDWSSEGTFNTLSEFNYRPMLALGIPANDNLKIINQNGDLFNQEMIYDANLDNELLYSVSFSSDGNYLAFAQRNRIPGVTVYKRNGFRFRDKCTVNNLSNNGGTSGGVSKVSFSPDGNYLASISRGTTEGVSTTQIFRRTGDVFNRIFNGTYVTGAEKTGLTWSHDSQYVCAMTQNASSLQFYKVVGDTVTDLTSNIDVQIPASNGAVYGNRLSFTPDNTILAVGHSTTPFVSFYVKSGDTLTKIPGNNVDAANELINNTVWHPYLPYLFVTTGNSDRQIMVYERLSGDNFRLVANGLGLTGDYGTTGTALDISVDGNYIAYSDTVSPFYRIFKWDSDTRTYRVLSTPGFPSLTTWASSVSFC